MKEIKEQLEQTIKELDEVSDYLYQQKIHTGYQKLNTALAGLINRIENFYSYARDNNLQFDENKFNSNLETAMNAMQQKDIILLADILTYEIVEQLKEFDSII